VIFSLAWQIEATKSKPIDSMIEASKNKRIPTLSCHVCHSETHAGCFNFTEYGEDFEGYPGSCAADYNICVVSYVTECWWIYITDLLVT